MPPFSQNDFFFRHFLYFSVTKAIHTYLCSGNVRENLIFFIFNISARFLQTTTLKILAAWQKAVKLVLNENQGVPVANSWIKYWIDIYL